eukprot:jgi/Bigna1/69205/fgenesh1_pg.8_\
MGHVDGGTLLPWPGVVMALCLFLLVSPVQGGPRWYHDEANDYGGQRRRGADGMRSPGWQKMLRRVRKIAVRAAFLSIGLSLARKNHLIQIYLHNFPSALRSPLRGYLAFGDQVIGTGESMMDALKADGIIVERSGPRLLPPSQYIDAEGSSSSSTSSRVKTLAGKAANTVGNAVDSLDQAAGEVVEGLYDVYKEMRAEKR